MAGAGEYLKSGATKCHVSDGDNQGAGLCRGTGRVVPGPEGMSPLLCVPAPSL